MDVLFDILDEKGQFGNKAPFLTIKWWLVIAIFCSFCAAMNGQIDTIIQMNEVEFSATSIKKDGRGSLIQHFDKETLTNYQNQSLSRLLAEKSNVFIKSYGANTLATISLRGTGSNHTAVLWNGLNLQSSMNGSVDFNLVPVFFMENIDLQKGGSSARYGSGAIGGSLHLNSYQKPKSGWHGKMGGIGGSFGKLEGFGKLSFGAKKWNSSLKFIHRQAENDYTLLSSPANKQTNAQFQQAGITNDTYFKINEKQSLKSFFWYQKTERQIPPTRSENFSDAQQNDESLRIGLDWNNVGRSAVMKAKIAFLQDDLLFFSSAVDSAQSLTKTFIVEVQQDLFLKKSQTLRIGGQYQRRWARADGFDDIQLQNRTAIWSSYQRNFFQDRLSWTTNIRQELVDNQFIPLTGSTGANWAVSSLINVRAKISKNYNLPTFNDLFWADGFGQGNPDLAPESGWSEELGIDFQKKFKKIKWQSSLTGFYSITENWILWQPTNSTWQPGNEREVHARGFEIGTSIDYAFTDWQFFTKMNYSFTKSTGEKINDGDNPRQLGKQLLYVPLHTSDFNLKITYQNTSLQYQHQWIGKRQTTRDNNEAEAAPAYQVAQLLVAHQFTFAKNNLRLQMTIANLWNQNYEVIAFRPMPGRTFELGVVFDF